MSDTKKKPEPAARKRPKPKRMNAYGTEPGRDMSKPERIADRGGCVFVTSAAERARVKRRPRKAARQDAKATIREEQ